MSAAEKQLPIRIDAAFGTVECRSWIEAELLPNGDMRFVGMGSKIVRDKDGKITECKIEPTGLTMTSDGPPGSIRGKARWWLSLFGICRE